MPAMHQVNRQCLNLEVLKHKSQRVVLQRLGTLIVEYTGHAHALGCSPNGRLGR